MTLPILIDLAVGEPDGDPAVVSLADAVTIAGAAERAEVTALRLVDRPGLIDPSIVAGYLAGIYPALGYVVEIPTTHNAPYNAARRVLSLDRADVGRIGVALIAGDGDEVSDAVAPDPSATDQAQRWAEFARILALLWESFPADALIGDQEAALVVDVDLIRPIHHEGRFYRVAGPLDGPSSPQGRPVLAADLGVLDWSSVAESADLVVVDRDGIRRAAEERATASLAVDRRSAEIVLVGRVTFDPTSDPAAELPDVLDWAHASEADALELVPTTGATSVLDLIAALERLTATGRGAPVTGTLRGSLGLPEVAETLA